MTLEPLTGTTAQDLETVIDASKERTEIVYCEHDDALARALQAECEGSVEVNDDGGRTVREYWGEDCDGNAWRVHLIEEHKADDELQDAIEALDGEGKVVVYGDGLVTIDDDVYSVHPAGSSWGHAAIRFTLNGQKLELVEDSSTLITVDTLTTEQVEALRSEAATAGEAVTCTLCDVVLGRSDDRGVTTNQARREIVEILREAQAQRGCGGRR